MAYKIINQKKNYISNLFIDDIDIIVIDLFIYHYYEKMYDEIIEI